MAVLTPQQVQLTGTEATYQTAAGGGDSFAPGGDLVLHVKNGDAADKTVTIVRPGSTYGQANPDIAVVVTAGEERFIGPFPSDLADTDGKLDVTYSATTSVTVALLRV